MNGLPSTLEQLLADRIQELPAEEHAVVDWLAIAGGPLCLDRPRQARRRRPTTKPSSASARAACATAKGSTSTSGTRSRATSPTQALDPAARTRMHRELGEHLARDLAGARALGGDRRAAPRPRRGGGAGRRVLPRGRARRARRVPDAARDPVLPARALAHAAGGLARCSAAHEALEAIYRVLGRRKERVKHLDALRRVAKEAGTPRAVVPRAPAHGAVQPRRGAALARAADRAGRRRRCRRARGSRRRRSRRRRLVSEILARARRRPGRARRVRPRARRVRPEGERERPAAHARRRAPLARHPPPPRGARARGGRRVRRRDRRLPPRGRAPPGGAREERARVRDVRAGAVRGRRSRSRSSRSKSTSRSAAASSSPRR